MKTELSLFDFIERTRLFANSFETVQWPDDVVVYNPLKYAWNNHREYIEKFVKPGAKCLFLGMNPGPFGMLQNGVPFGEKTTVTEYLKITGAVERPAVEHEQRPVVWPNVTRREVSGMRLWSLIQNRFPNCDFTTENCIMNYCPLAFVKKGKGAANVTPDKFDTSLRRVLDEKCLSYLKDVIDYVNPVFLIGVGKYAAQKLQLCGSGKKIISIIHPSPANPAANNGWDVKTIQILTECGAWQ